MAPKDVKDPAVYCFPDTNIFLHFLTFDEVEWTEKLKTKQVYLVLAPIVIRELDKHKGDYTNLKRQRRARMLMPKLLKLIELEGEGLPKIRENVFLVLLREPQIDWDAEHLVPAVNDDQLIASILDFSRQHPAEKVLLLSDDGGPRSKAKIHQIPSVSPQHVGIDPLPDQPSPEEVENRKLKEQLQAFTNRVPVFRFGFLQNGTITKEISCTAESTWRWQTADEFMQKKIRSAQVKLKKMLAQAASNNVSQTDIRKLSEKYERYISGLNPGIKMQYVKNYQPSCRLELALFNDGTAYAHNVSITLTFPDGSTIIKLKSINEEVIVKDEIPEEPDIPEWAEPPDTSIVGGMLATLKIPELFNFSTLAASFNYSPNLFALSGSDKLTYYDYTFPFGRHQLRKDFDSIGHTNYEKVIPILTYLPPTAQRGFVIRYEVIAEEMLRPERGELQVNWQ